MAPHGGAGRTPLPSFGDIIFFFPVYMLLVLLPNFVFNDASTGWHLVTGQYITDNLRVPHQDLISYTFAQKRWVPYEWLFDAVAAVLVRVGGLQLLAVATASSIAWLFLLVYESARRTGCHFLIVLALIVIGCLTSSIHWLARPHLFTFFGVYVYARYLRAFHTNEISTLQLNVILGVTMVVWANAHPGFLFGFAMIAIYLISEAVSALALPPGGERGAARKRAEGLLATLAIASVGSLITPHGLALYPYIGALLRQPVLGGMQEWMPPTFRGQVQVHAMALELLFAAIILGFATSRRRPWLGQVLLVLAFGHLALTSMRNEPLFVIVSLPFIAGLFAESNLLGWIAGGSMQSPGWLEPAKRRWQRLARTVDAVESGCNMHLIPLAAIAILALSCIAAARVPGTHALVSSRFDPKNVPTGTLSYISENHLAWNRGFNFDNWGGYIRYATGQRVFIDDRVDFYGSEFYLRYVQTSAVRPGWNRLFDEYGVEWVLIPKSAPLADALGRSADWQRRVEDPAAYLFVREPMRGRAKLPAVPPR